MNKIQEAEVKDFKDKILFVTGGGSGAGFGQAKVFSEAGCKVVIADVRQDHLDQAMAYFREKNAPAHAIKLDITDRAAYAAAADEVEQVFGGPPQILFNTAGVNTFGPPEASTYEDYDWVMGVCLGGVINGMVTFVPRMIKAGKGGYIATTASMGGFWGSPMTAPYSAAKAAVINLMESYHISLAKYGIGVSVLCPASINSNIHNAGETRPAHLQNTGYLMDEKAIDTLGYHLRVGHGSGRSRQVAQEGHRGRAALHHPLSRRAGGSRDGTSRRSSTRCCRWKPTPKGARRRLEAWKAIGERAMEEAKKDPAKPSSVGFGRCPAGAGLGQARADPSDGDAGRLGRFGIVPVAGTQHPHDPAEHGEAQGERAHKFHPAPQIQRHQEHPGARHHHERGAHERRH